MVPFIAVKNLFNDGMFSVFNNRELDVCKEVCKAVQDTKQPESCAGTLKEWGIALQKMMDVS